MYVYIWIKVFVLDLSHSICNTMLLLFYSLQILHGFVPPLVLYRKKCKLEYKESFWKTQNGCGQPSNQS